MVSLLPWFGLWARVSIFEYVDRLKWLSHFRRIRIMIMTANKENAAANRRKSATFVSLLQRLPPLLPA